MAWDVPHGQMRLQMAHTLGVLQAAGKKGKRYSMPNARIMMHSPAGNQVPADMHSWLCHAGR